MSTSVRTLEIQRFPTNPMTALACHPRLPLLASGSDQNFVKVFTNDGDVLEVIRHHDALNGMKIGRVSTLAFHPNRPLLAAGTTDDIISIYGTSKYRKMSSRGR
jgi:WD40 repeat protein